MIEARPSRGEWAMFYAVAFVPPALFAWFLFVVGR